MGFVRADWNAFVRAMQYATAPAPRRGSGRRVPVCLDVGGGQGELRNMVAANGFRYVNLDIAPGAGVDVVADAHAMPIASESVELVITTNALEHMVNAWDVTREMFRVMKAGGRLVILVPFLHPFHGDDVARYSAHGLRKLLSPLLIESLEVPSHVMTIIGVSIGVVFWKLRLYTMCRLARDWLSLGDRVLSSLGLRFESWAHSYLVVARKPEHAALAGVDAETTR